MKDNEDSKHEALRESNKGACFRWVREVLSENGTPSRATGMSAVPPKARKESSM